MNRCWSQLDHLTMMSNSDAHSLHNIGRELNMFETDKSYNGLFEAVKTKTGFGGTLEFFPEEGKYTYDGHRKCGICFSPEQSRHHNSICPVCKTQVTIGAMHQVERLTGSALAVPPSVTEGFHHVIPLREIVAELNGMAGKDGVKVTAAFAKAIAAFGNEFSILQEAPVADIEKFDPLLGQAISRMRAGKVKTVIPGYDNKYGRILLFDEYELKTRRIPQLSLFG